MAKVIVQETLVSFLRNELLSCKYLGIGRGKTLNYGYNGKKIDVGFVDSKSNTIILYTNNVGEHPLEKIIDKLSQVLQHYKNDNPTSQVCVTIKLVVN
jgi:hypothetical protein